MHALDWAILGLFLAVIVGIVLFTRRYMRSVADFLAGNRVAGRYLLTIAAEMGGLGAISIVAQWEASYHSGWGGTWWAVVLAPVWVIITLSGWVVYRFRETRALTLAQFFEIRYSRRFRVFAGLLTFLSGTLNFGIFPSVGARFLICFCGLPECPVDLGGFELSLTFALLMLGLMGFSLWITLSGGQIAIMVSDAVQGLLCLLIAAGLTFWCVHRVGWDQIGEALRMAPDPEHASMVNPFKTANVRDFNLWFYLIGMFSAFYSCMAWQGTSGFNAAARTPHEARMARVLATWRGGTLLLLFGFLAMCAYTVMHHPDFAAFADAVRGQIAAIANPALQKQMTVPVILSNFLPVGLLGLLCSIVVSAAITSDDSYLHSWGTIFIQDVVLPLRKQQPLTPEQHIRWLRRSVVGVAAFAYLFSLLFRQTQYLLMFMAMTGTIFLGGAGSAIIGGLYWKRGTAAAAWGAMLTGATLAALGIVLHQLPFATVPVRLAAPDATRVTIGGQPATRTAGGWAGPFEIWRGGEWQACEIVTTGPAGVATNRVHYLFAPPAGKIAPPAEAPPPAAFPRVVPADDSTLPVPAGTGARLYHRLRSTNGQVLYFIAMCSALSVYVLISLFQRKEFDMDRLLHRGAHAVARDRDTGAAVEQPVRGWRALLGVTREFTRGDRILYYCTVAWTLGWILVYFTLIAINLVRVRGDALWVGYYQYKFFIYFAVGLGTTVWFLIGGTRDIVRLFRALAVLRRDATDDGRVPAVGAGAADGCGGLPDPRPSVSIRGSSNERLSGDQKAGMQTAGPDADDRKSDRG